MMRKIRMQTGEMNMLEGPLLGKIFAFALPLMLTNLMQTCYSAADMIIVGLSGVDGAIGAIGTTNAMINLVHTLFPISIIIIEKYICKYRRQHCIYILRI